MAESEFDHKTLGHKVDEKSLSNGVEEEPDFSDPEDFVDEIDEQDLLSDILKTRPRPQDGLENVIVIDRLPLIGPDRLEKLRAVMRKLLSQTGEIVHDHYPLDENQVTLGYVFVEYKTREAAAEAVKILDGHKLDKNHVFVANLFTDIEKYSKILADWQPPEPKPYVDRGNLKSWLLNPDCFDQYSVLHSTGITATIYLNSNPEPRQIKTRDNWTDTEIVWSPLGTYLATYHKKGIALWGGETFEQIMRFPHDDVKGIEFSPRENYLLTFSHSLATFDDPDAFIIWDIRTGLKKRSFHAERPNVSWPVFKWSHDDKYFARIVQDNLQIYETPSMMLLDRKSVKLPGIQGFSWSSSQNLLAFWVAEDRDVPARVTLIEIPSRRELRSKNLFSVTDCRMHWQKTGDYLCVKVDRYVKLKKEKTNDNKEKATPIGLYYNFEIFHVKEKQIPVDSVEIKENIIAFAWEPIGDKFAIIHGDGAQSHSVSFYSVKSGVAVSLTKKFDNKTFNHLFWSPSGQFIVLAGLKGSNNALEFIDTSDFTTTSTQEHMMATDVEWDPTGRFVVTSSSCWESRGDNNYWFWTFQGRLIRKVNVDGFCQFLWRPRPPTLLNEAKINEIKKNLKKYSPQFELKDKAAMSRISEEILAKRKQLMESFKSYRDRREKDHQQSLSKRAKLREGKGETGGKEEVEEERVEFLTREETILCK